MGDIILFPDGIERSWDIVEETLQPYLLGIFHSKEKRDLIIAHMKDYYDLIMNPHWTVTLVNANVYPIELQKPIRAALGNAENDIKKLLTNIISPGIVQGFHDLLKKEIECQLNDQK